MVKHMCLNCSKQFVRKKDLLYHTKNKKNPCLLINNNNSTDIPEYSRIFQNIPENIIKNKNNNTCKYCSKIFSTKFNLNKHIKNNCKLKKIDEKILDNKQVNIDELDIDDKTKTILSLLLNQNKKLINELKEEMDKIKEENKEMKEKNKEITEKISKINKKKTINNNNINTQNTQNNQNNTINNNVILAHGKEDLSKIDLETIMKCMSTIKHRNNTKYNKTCVFK